MEAAGGVKLWEVLVGVAAIVGTLYTALNFHYPTIKAELAEDPDYRRKKAEALKHPAIWRLYGEYLALGLGWLELHMGRPWSGRAFGVCFLLAVAYSLLFLLVAWAFGGPGTVGATVLLPDLPLLARMAIAAVIVIFAGIFSWVLRPTGEMRASLEARSARSVHRTGRALPPVRRGSRLYRGVGVLLVVSITGTALYFFGRAFVFLGALALGFLVPLLAALALAGAVPLAVSMAAAFAGGLAFAGAGAFAGTLAFVAPLALAGYVVLFSAENLASIGRGAAAFAVAGWIVVALTLDREFSSPANVVVLLFAAILPLLNAVWDWLSWWISRALGEHQLAAIRGSAPWWRKLWTSARHMAVDLMAAVALVVALAFTLPLAVDGYNALAKWIAAEPPLVLDAFLCDAARRPWSDGLWATLMLLSTLLPTALHLGAVLASPSVFLFLPRERWQAIALELEQEIPPPRALRAAARHFAVVRPLTYVTAFIVACLLLYGLWRLFHLAGPVRLLLLTVATRDAEFARSCLAGAGGIAG